MIKQLNVLTTKKATTISMRAYTQHCTQQLRVVKIVRCALEPCSLCDSGLNKLRATCRIRFHKSRYLNVVMVQSHDEKA